MDVTRLMGFMVADKGKVFGWGNSEYGQLLVRGENQQVNIATEISSLKQFGHIIDIASGGCFCMVLNSKFIRRPCSFYIVQCNNFNTYVY